MSEGFDGPVGVFHVCVLGKDKASNGNSTVEPVDLGSKLLHEVSI